MNGVLFNIAAFLVALGVLVTVHEFGHYWVARRVGVKVLRFSIGFGQPIWRWRRGADQTEFVIAAIPLGGYVKMLDEREGEVPAEERARAFNRKPVGSRMAVVVAGPLFNFLLAILVYWLMYTSGVPGVKPVVGELVADSYASASGLRERDQILSVDGTATPSWESAILALLDGALDRRALELQVQGADQVQRSLTLDLTGAEGLLDRGDLMAKLGFQPYRPLLPAVIEKVVAGGAAQQAGLRGGDHIVRADGKEIADWGAWVDYVRARPEQIIELQIMRDGERLDMQLRPAAEQLDDELIGRIGAYVHVPESLGEELRTTVRYDIGSAFVQSLVKTWDMSMLTLRTLWKMLVGEASLENLSGPISIAQYAGHTASIGFASFLGFLGIVSISLGVLNLLPIPILDGGHLLYYLIELVTGKPVSERTEILGQRIGIIVLFMLMSLALFNDFTRLMR